MSPMYIIISRNKYVSNHCTSLALTVYYTTGTYLVECLLFSENNTTTFPEHTDPFTRVSDAVEGDFI